MDNANDTTLVAWGEGDRTVGDGTFHAELTFTNFPSYLVSLAKAELQRACSTIWDLDARRVTVMTREEYEAYTRGEAQE